MATEAEKIGQLREFLMDAFRAPEFEMFLTLKGYGEIVSAVNSNAGASEYFFNVTQALARWGRIDDAFFQHLRKDRPSREAEIRGLQESWLVSVPSVVNQAGGRTGVSNRLKLVRGLNGLAPPDWATLVTAIPGAASHVSRQGTVAEQVAELVRWAEGSTGPGLAAVEEVLDGLRNP